VFLSISKFEDIVAWQRAREIVKDIYKLTGSQGFHHDFTLRDQMRRSALSIMANIAEGFHRWNRKDFLRFLQMSLASACETRSHCHVALDLGYISNSEFENMTNSLDDTVRLITALMNALRKKESDTQNK